MKILAIETSCDETALSIVEADGKSGGISFETLSNSLLSQAALHQEYGGVYPNLARREHSRNLAPLLQKTLAEAGMLEQALRPLSKEQITALKNILSREPELFVLLIAFLSNMRKPELDAIAVTYGPGLEPALWVGINFGKALSEAWGIPLIPVNHMEGHLLSPLIRNNSIVSIEFPALALLISGGHTQLVVMTRFGKYEVVGGTRDDAVGEAFDKVARMLDLAYPGGPEISKLAKIAREENLERAIPLPRPMIDTDNLDFSFSGLKTAVLYRIKAIEKEGGKISETQKKQLAREFEDAVADVLLKKTKEAIEKYHIKTFLLGGGVSANRHIRYVLETHLPQDVDRYIPSEELTGDNAIMIGAAAYVRYVTKKSVPNMDKVVADGNLTLK